MKHYIILKDEERVFHGYEKEAIEYLSRNAKDFNGSLETKDFQVTEYPYYLAEEVTEETIIVEGDTTRERQLIIEGMRRHEPEILKVLRETKKLWTIPELSALEGW